MLARILAGAALALSLVVSGCGSSGVQNAELLNQPLRGKQARIKIVRSSSFAGSAAASRVHIDGKQIADLGNGASVVHDVPAGKHEVAISVLLDPRETKITIDAKPGVLYTYEITPRDDAVVASMFGLAGQAIDAAASGGAGYFEVNLLNEKPIT